MPTDDCAVYPWITTPDITSTQSPVLVNTDVQESAQQYIQDSEMCLSYLHFQMQDDEWYFKRGWMIQWIPFPEKVTVRSQTSAQTADSCSFW